jgi:hypothetical protein
MPGHEVFNSIVHIKHQVLLRDAFVALDPKPSGNSNFFMRVLGVEATI